MHYYNESSVSKDLELQHNVVMLVEPLFSVHKHWPVPHGSRARIGAAEGIAGA